jgi:hypothetical protein
MFRRRPKTLPTDDEVAASMRDYAEIFVESMAVDGFTFDWDPGAAHKLDGCCEHFLGGRPDQRETELMTVAMGAYLGELIVRNAAGRWKHHEEQGAAVEVGTRTCFPHNKVAKRLELGDEHALWAFYEYAVTGEAPPGAHAAPPRSDVVNPPGGSDLPT